jgi:hypothetical protein
MAPLNQRKQVIRSCKARGVTVHPAVLPALEEHVDNLTDVLDGLSLLPSFSNRITPEIWQAFVIETTQLAASDASTKEKTTCIEVISAYKTPKLVYDSRRKQYRVIEKQGPVLGCAIDKVRRWTLLLFVDEANMAFYQKVNMLLDRYQLIQQRVLRNEVFRPKSLHERPMQLTPVASLLGGKTTTSGQKNNHVLLLGVLVRTSETEFSLEDPTGQVRIDFSMAQQHNVSSVLVEHSILIVEGTFHDHVLRVEQIGQPLPESRKVSLKALQPHLSHPHYALPKGLPATVAVLFGSSNIDKVVSQARPDVLVVLLSVQDDLDSIPDDDHFVATKLVLVPPCQAAVWPMPPMSSKTTSNPCRIRLPQELVIWNAPMRQLWNEQAPRIGDQADWMTTPLDQGTLAPPATTPVHWNYAHAMSLYPIPDALVVVGTDPVTRTHGDCEILQLPQHDSDFYAMFDEEGWHLHSLD